MWEYWRSRLSKGKTRHRKRTGSDGDSPTAQGCGHCPVPVSKRCSHAAPAAHAFAQCLPPSQQTGRCIAICLLYSRGQCLALSEHAAWHICLTGKLPRLCLLAPRCTCTPAELGVGTCGPNV